MTDAKAASMMGSDHRQREMFPYLQGNASFSTKKGDAVLSGLCGGFGKDDAILARISLQ